MEREVGSKPHISLAAIGDIGVGKSTTLGHLLYLCGSIDKGTIERYEREATEIGQGAHKYAWVLDTLDGERERGITINTSARWQLKTKKYHFTLIDTPGHERFIKNMIRGTCQADLALLIVSARCGEFEAGLVRNGRTHEHVLLAYTFGVKQMICCVNKMDDPSVNWSQQRYDEIVSEVSACIKKVGYNPDKVLFIPISAWNGDNMIEKSPNLHWYSGPSLQESLDMVLPPKRYTDKPLRLPVLDVYRIGGIGTVLAGRVETGVLRTDMSLIIAREDGNRNPDRSRRNHCVTTVVKSVERHHASLTEAIPGEIVGFSVKGLSIRDVSRGCVVSDSQNDPAKICKSFIAKVIVLHYPTQIKAGYAPMLYCHTANVRCCFSSLLSKIDRITGAVLDEEPTSIKAGDCALVHVIPQQALCVETFTEYPQLGRFAVRDLSLTVAVGIIRSVEKVEPGEIFNPSRIDNKG